MVAPAGSSPRSTWRLRDRVLSLERPLVMGVLNLTPDSFSDGGELPTVDHAVGRAESMVEEGAGMLDLGAESTRPGAEAVSEEEELRRLMPAMEALAGRVSVPLSVDTRKAEVARRAVEAGASVVNDVSGFGYDPEMASVVAEAGAGAVLMHMRGTPADMRERASYGDLTGEIVAELGRSVERARAAGVADDAVVLDPGIGFAKTPGQSFRVIRDLARLGELGFPVLVGPSRKSFLGALLGVPPRDRAAASGVVSAIAYLRGARIFRTHDVAVTVQALAVARAVEEGGIPDEGGEGAPSEAGETVRLSR